MLGIFSLKKRLSWLKFVFSRDILDKFNPGLTLPVIHVRKLKDVAVGTSYIDYSTNEIILAVDDRFDAKKQWKFVKFVCVHELLHKAFDFMPSKAGFEEEVKYKILNIFRDCKNEQTASRKDARCRNIISAGRKSVLDDGFDGYGNMHPMIECLNLILIAHTKLLAIHVKEFKKFCKNQISANELWEILLDGTPVRNAELSELWDKTRLKSLILRIWATENNHHLFDLINDFFALFPDMPKPEDIPEMFTGSTDNHDAEGAGLEGGQSDEAADNDSKEESGENSADNTAGTDEDASDGTGSAGSSSEDENGSIESAGNQTGSPENSDPNGQCVFFENDQTDDYDDGTGIDEASEAEDVQDEINELNKPSRGSLAVSSGNYMPQESTELEYAAEPFIGDFSVSLETLNADCSRSYTDAGRFSTRKWVRNTSSVNCFTSRRHSVPQITDKYKLTVVFDTSGSMTDAGQLGLSKSYLSKLSAMVIHKAMRRAGMPYQLLCSRSLELIASDEEDEIRCETMIAGFDADHYSGDGYLENLPILYRALSEDKEYSHILICLTDGCWGGNTSHIVRQGREAGIVSFGIGIDLDPGEIEQLTENFGEEFTVAAFTGDSSNSFAKQISRKITEIITLYAA